MGEFAIDNAWQESVQETPFMLNYGQHPLNFLSLHIHSHVPAEAEFHREYAAGYCMRQELSGACPQRHK